VLRKQPAVKQSEQSYRQQLKQSQKIKHEGGIDAVIRGSQTHMQRILQASQMKIEE